MNTKILKTSDLFDIDKQKKDKLKELCEQLLQECYSKIKYRHKHGYNYSIYSVPTIVPGYPLFDVKEVIKYMIKKLQIGGFEIFLYNNGNLHIQWNNTVKKQSTKVVKFKADNVQHPKTTGTGNNYMGRFDEVSMSKELEKLVQARKKI